MVSPKKTSITKNVQKEKKMLYHEGVGRRKNAIARVRIFKKTGGEMKVNGKGDILSATSKELNIIMCSPLKITKTEKDFSVEARVRGGGIKAQAEAIKLGLSRALLKFNPDFRQTLKQNNFLTRDARVKERRKFGLKKARKAPQWSKR